CGGLCYAELAAMFPKTGGDYVYVTAAYGRCAGFLFGWTKLFIERTGTIAVLAIVFASYLGQLLPPVPRLTPCLATGAIILLTVTNAVGIYAGKVVQNSLTLIKIAALGTILLTGVGSSHANWQPFAAAPAWSWSLVPSLGTALVFVLWTYGGWVESAYVAEEVQEPRRDIPWSIIGGIAATTALYLGVNAVYLAYVSVEEMPRQPLVAATMMRRAIGPLGGEFIAVMVACSAFGALNGYILTGGRILYALGQDHGLFARLGRLHPKFETPAKALIAAGACAILLVWWGTFDQILTYTTVVITLFYILTAASVFLWRRREPFDSPRRKGVARSGRMSFDSARLQRASLRMLSAVEALSEVEAEPLRVRPYRVWGYPATPLLFIVTMAWFMVNAFRQQPREACLGLALLCAGVPLYAWSQMLTKRS
ncbi:MAG: APC family permease, partial [Candidatus Omnitrophica bacterium]|nr:APC family permease [Candidatus Omnitrophota bacterium]